MSSLPEGTELLAERIALLRMAAAGRREYAEGQGIQSIKNDLELQAVTLESAARIMEGSLTPLYGLLPSWRWTDEMVEKTNDWDHLK